MVRSLSADTMARASAGTARFPEHAADAESLFRAADPAMYSVKRSGKDRVALAGASARMRLFRRSSTMRRISASSSVDVSVRNQLVDRA